jgi:hypothetical protein
MITAERPHLKTPPHAREARTMVFGIDREVGSRWLQRFRPLAEGIEFHFLDQTGLIRI